MTGPTGSARLFCARLRNVRGLAQNLQDPPVVVLCYHRVTAGSSDINSIAVTPANFRDQIEYLKKHYRIVRFEDDWSQIKKPAIVITFDDGYADNLSAALPILERTQVPATFFISTGQIGSASGLWWDTLESSLLGEKEYPETFTLDHPQQGKTWPTATLEQRGALYRDLHVLFMVATMEQRKAWLAELAAWSGDMKAGTESARLLTLEELQVLAQHPLVTIGAHTVSHPRLSSLGEAEQRQEIAQSRHQLEKWLGKEVTVFAYPFGQKTDYDENSTRICREECFLKAAAAFPGEAHRWSDPFQIPRHFVYNWDLEKFVYKLKRLWI
jgi:peptidoglycan/xylan/chitin deacetylase (PgdA/CDA1 family)